MSTLRVRSVLPETMTLLAIWLDQTPPVWPTSVRRHFPVIALHTCRAIIVQLIQNMEHSIAAVYDSIR